MSVKWEGLREFETELRQMPDRLADQCEDPVGDATAAAAAQLIQAYPEGDTGNLRKGVRTRIKRTPGTVTGEVRSTSPHSHLWEYGTVNRETRRGWQRGRMKSAKERSLERLGSIAARTRRAMNTRIEDFLRRAGFELSGDV